MADSAGEVVPCEVSVKMQKPAQVAGARMTAIITATAGTAYQENEMPGAGRSRTPATYSGSAVRGGYAMKYDVKKRSANELCSRVMNEIPVETKDSKNDSAEASQRRRRVMEGMEKDGLVMLSYIVVEISGRWICDNSWVAPHAHERERELEDVSRFGGEAWGGALDDASHYGGGGFDGYSGFIFRTKPHIVTRDEPLLCGSQMVFEVSCELPDLIPPSLRGTAVRYSYAVAVVATFESYSPKSLRVPFRVVLAPDAPQRTEVIPVPYSQDLNDELSEFASIYHPEEPLHVRSRVMTSLPPQDIDLALAMSLNGRLTPYQSDSELNSSEAPELNQELLMSESRSDSIGSLLMGGSNGAIEQAFSRLGFVEPKTKDPVPPATSSAQKEVLPVYLLTKGDKKIGRLFLLKTVHELGETLTAIFDMTEKEISCYRLSASLEVQEVVNPKFSLGTKDRNSREAETGRVFRKVYGEHNEYVNQSLNTYLVLSIPRDAPVSFQTQAVTVKWQLLFAFLTPSETGAANGSTDELDDEQWFVPQKDADVLHWTLPIAVTGNANS
mmetsp:Transcript_6535/g.19828  ORF Transcript_6535/g.19828 Transcript_6535/m.19828 type:complete len:556 (+) Transcript_6535:66-1733(+)